MGSIISARLATMTELTTTLSLEDAYLLLDIVAIDSYNNRPPT